MSPPRITVLMPVHNGAEYLKEAIESILSQTFKDFEFLIIDDGSTDNSEKIVRSYADPRIRLVRNIENIGLAATLNKGIGLARADYIARMDCDDVSLPCRLEKQVRFMDLHADVGICGSWIKIIKKGRRTIMRYPTDDEAVKCFLIFCSAFAHPSVIFRKSIFVENDLRYDVSYRGAEDYDLWVRASNFCKFANLPEVLLNYRVHPKQVSNVGGVHQRSEANLVRAKQISGLGIEMSTELANFHGAISECQFPFEKNFILQAEAWLGKLVAQNNKTMIYPRHAFNDAIADWWFRLCWSAASSGLWPLKIYRRSKLKTTRTASLRLEFILFAKCLIAYRHASNVRRLNGASR